MSNLQDRRDARRDMMLTGKLIKVIPYVAFPMIVSMLIDSIYNLADTYFVSQIGLSATAAVAVNDALLHLMRSVAMGFGTGAGTIISRYMGAKRENEASEVATTTVVTSAVVLTTVAVIAYIFRSPMVTLFGATETSKPYAIQYASFILISAPFTAVEVTCNQVLRSEGSTTYSMIGMSSGCLINCALDPLFINVLNMGVAGAAIATTISKFIAACILISPFLRNKTLVELKPKFFKPSLAMYKDISKMGIPTFLRSAMFSVSGIVTNNVAKPFGDVVLAAVSIANKSTRLVGTGIMGFGTGFQPVAGYCYGGKKYKRIIEAFWTCSAIGAAGAVVLGGAMIIFAPNIINIFAAATETEAIKLGAVIIRTQCVTLFPHVWSMVINGLTQALGKPVEATIIGLSRQVICYIPMLLLLSNVWGVTGIAHSQAFADIFSAAIAFAFAAREIRLLKIKQAELEAEEAAEKAAAVQPAQ